MHRRPFVKPRQSQAQTHTHTHTHTYTHTHTHAHAHRERQKERERTLWTEDWVSNQDKVGLNLATVHADSQVDSPIVVRESYANPNRMSTSPVSALFFCMMMCVWVCAFVCVRQNMMVRSLYTTPNRMPMRPHPHPPLLYVYVYICVCVWERVDIRTWWCAHSTWPQTEFVLILSASSFSEGICVYMCVCRKVYVYTCVCVATCIYQNMMMC